jgi:uncharacterized protein YjaZ
MNKFEKENKGLLDNSRFEEMHQQEITYLKNLSINESIKIMESLLDSGFVEECKKIHKYLSNQK